MERVESSSSCHSDKHADVLERARDAIRNVDPSIQRAPRGDMHEKRKETLVPGVRTDLNAAWSAPNAVVMTPTAATSLVGAANAAITIYGVLMDVHRERNREFDTNEPEKRQRWVCVRTVPQ